MALRVEPERQGAARLSPVGRHPTIAAVAMVDFTIDASGRCRKVALHGLHRETAGEFVLVAAAERSLAELHAGEGRLVTTDGGQDLALLRMGALRHRQFRLGAAAHWQRDPRDAHDDVLEMLDPTATARRQARWFAATVAGRSPRVRATAPAAQPAQARAQLAVLSTVITYLHLVSERRSDPATLVTGVEALAELIASKGAFAPHLAPILDCALFAALAPQPF